MRIGLVGAGVIGQLRAKSIRESASTELAAVMDPSRAAAERAVSGTPARACTDLSTFLDIDMGAVVVSTPVHLHEPACRAAFERGRHVLCEKPLSNGVESCRRIVDAAQAANRILAVGFNLRYFPAFAFIKKVLDEGRIGDVDHLRIFGGHDGVGNFRSDWEYRAPESGGGAMMDIGIHMTDLARYFLGEITEVCGVMSESVWNVPGSEDNAVAVFRNPNGIPATYHATWNEWKGYRISVDAYGSRGMVRGSYGPMLNLLITQDRPGGARRTERVWYPRIMIREKLTSWKSTVVVSFKEELRDFVARIEGGSSAPLADGHAGLRAVEIAAAVRLSSERREVVPLPVLGRPAP